MPKPHFPVRGGPRPSEWSSTPPEAYAHSLPPDSHPPHELEAEVRRLREELARTQASSPRRAHAGVASIPMVWIALGACGVALLFALLAILRHG